MKNKVRVLLLAAAVFVAAIGGMFVHETVKAPPASAAVYCAPWVNMNCWLRYQHCGPYFWYQGIGWIDLCGSQLL